MLSIIVICVSIVLGLEINKYIHKKDKEKQPIITEDSTKFAKEYVEVTQDNVFIYETPENIINLIKSGTGIIYFGYPECKWCQAYVQYLNEVAKEVGIQRISYINTRELKANNINKYYEIIELLKEHLTYNNGDKPVIYVPNVTFVLNGKIIANDNSTAIENSVDEPEQYWDDKKVNELKHKLRKYIKNARTLESVSPTVTDFMSPLICLKPDFEIRIAK